MNEVKALILSACMKTPTSALRSSEKCSFTLVNSAFSDFASLELGVFLLCTRVSVQTLLMCNNL